MVIETSKRLLALAVLATLLPVAVVVAEPIDGTNYTKAFSSEIAVVASDQVSKTGITMLAVISAYNNEERQTNSDPNTMANGERVYEGAIACPRDLPFGTMIEINGEFYKCTDRMNLRYMNKEHPHFDIFMFSYAEAIKFGRQKIEITVYPV